MIPQDSARFWFPKLQAYPDAWLKQFLPPTVFEDYNEDLLAPSLMGGATAEYESLYYAVESAILDRIGYPAFIRTDLTSAKHAGRSAYVIAKADDINHALLTTLSHAQLKSYHSKVKSTAIMVRPLLDLNFHRTAFLGLPIVKEWRIFADQRGTQCHHYYWPEEALKGHMDDGGEPDEGLYWTPTEAIDAAAMAGKAMGGLKWSVDFVEDKAGKLWLLDMATAMNSYHNPACKFAQLDNFERI